MSNRRRRHRWFEAVAPDGHTMRICGDPGMPRETMDALLALGRAMDAMGEQMTTAARDEAARACRNAFLDWYGGQGAHETLMIRASQAPEDGEWRVEFAVQDEHEFQRGHGPFGWWGYAVYRSQDAASRYVADGWHCEQMDEGDSLLAVDDEWKEKDSREQS